VGKTDIEQEQELIGILRNMTNPGDRRFLLGMARKLAATQKPAKPALRLVVDNRDARRERVGAFVNDLR
jgi:hypothetical protein